MRRLLLLVTAIILAAPGTAAAADPVCKVPGPAAKAEKDLREQIRLRRHYGFRSDRAYVQSLIAQGSIVRGFEGLTVTPAEARYLERRRKVTPGAAVTRYLRRHPEISGWWDVRDDWPKGAYAAVFLTDDSPRQRATIRRLATFPDATRVVKVRYSDRQRERVQRRIEHDEKALAEAGFAAVETDAETGTDRVDVFVVSKRKDTARYFKRHYGVMVRTRATPETTVPGCARASTYSIAPDGRSLTVSWSDATKAQRIEVTESGDFVAVGVAVRYSVYPGFGDPGGTATANLGAPLADRPVYDAYDGSRLLQTGPSPGDPPCPEPPNREQTPLEQAIQQREEYGMNTDPAYVQTLLDAGQTYTPGEQRWLQNYQDIAYESKVDAYLQHWREDWGGNSVYAQYPDPPILVIRLLRRLPLHTKRLKALSQHPDQLRTITSTVQRDVFYELPYVIGDEARANGGFLDGYGRSGFYVNPDESDGDEGTQTVDIDVITTRTDAAAYFTRRFGPLVRVTVIGDRFECRGSYR